MKAPTPAGTYDYPKTAASSLVRIPGSRSACTGLCDRLKCTALVGSDWQDCDRATWPAESEQPDCTARANRLPAVGVEFVRLPRLDLFPGARRLLLGLAVKLT